MTITIGTRGRIVIPKAIREELGLFGPQTVLLEADEETGKLTIRPMPKKEVNKRLPRRQQ